MARRRVVMIRYYDCLKRAAQALACADAEDVHATDARVLAELSHADMTEMVQLTDAIQQIDADLRRPAG